MRNLMGQLASIMASTDGVPRVVRKESATFLVSPLGEVWRVFDSDDQAGEKRFAPSTDPAVRTRVFIGSGEKPVIKLYHFQQGEPRSTSAERLYDQLLFATAK
jgi:hypothetical protein